MNSIFELAVVISAIDRLSGPIKKMADNMAGFQKIMENGKAITKFGDCMTISGALIQGAADQTRTALTALTGPVAEVESAIGELRSVGVKNIQALQNAATEFASKWSGATEAQFIRSAYDIKGGIASLSDLAVAQYTTLAALTGKATKSSVDEMTSLFATGYGIYRDMYANMNDMRFGEMFGAGITGAVQQFKTTGSAMSQALTTLGAAATSARRPFEEQLAVLGMLQATMPGSEAGTKYKAFLQAAGKAGQQLGLNFVDSNNQLLAMGDILNTLRGKYGATLDAIEANQIQKAFGSDEAVALINLLYPKIGELRKNVDLMGQAMRQGTGYIQDIAQTMNSGLGEELGVVNQNMQILRRSLGQELSPLIKAAVPDIIKMCTGFKGFAQAHPTLVRTTLLLLLIGTVALSIIAPILLIGGSLAIMLGYFMMGVGKIGQGFVTIKSLGSIMLDFLKGGFLKLLLLLPKITSGFWSITSALLANPAIWIIAGIIALGAAIYLLWRNWDKVTAAIGRGWDWLMKKLDAGKQWFAGIFQGMANIGRQYGPVLLAAVFPIAGIPLLIARHWDTIKTIVPAKITELINNIRGKIADFRLSGAALFHAFTAGIKSVINLPVDLVKSSLAKLRRLLPFSDAKEGPLSALTYSGMALVTTFAGGIQKRSPYLQTIAQLTFANMIPVMAAASAAAPSWNGPRLGQTPRINLREVLKETVREREKESTYIRDRRPIVVVMQHPGGNKNYEDVVDLALRRLEMGGGSQ